MAQKIVLSVKNLTKVFQTGSVLPWKKKEKPFTAVNDISFEMKESEILGLLGPNGAGKTTTIQMLLSVLTPTRGTITYFGKDLQIHRSEVLKHVAFASTYINLPYRLSVWENLDVYGRLYGLTSTERRKRIERFLKFFGIWELRDKERSSLSAGQSTRLMLAKAFLAYPKIALLDEPTASLDPDIAHEVREFVLEQRKEYGVSILFTSHNMDEVTSVCDSVMFIKQGKILANDTPKKLASSVSKTTVHLLIGDEGEKAIFYAKKEKLEFSFDIGWLKIVIDEHEIAKLLSGFANAGIEYDQIRIDAPSLEQYFLEMTKK